MTSLSLIFTLILPSLLSVGIDAREYSPRRALPRLRRSNIPSTGFFDPTTNGGAMLTSVPGTFPAGLGEPINVIISANSDPDVLVDSSDNGGLRNYFFSFGFGAECLGQHLGSDQLADLGDGNGYLNETAVIRWDYGDSVLGTCKETFNGGNHFRYWVQNGKEADSGAVFLATSYEEPVADDHDIICNGYNFARDWLVGNATAQSTVIDTAALFAVPPPADLAIQTTTVQGTSTTASSSTTSASSTSSSPLPPPPLPTLTGSTTFNGYTYSTKTVYITGLLPNTSDGINHFITVGCNGTNAIDGLVAVMEVHITGRPTNSSSSSGALPSIPVIPAIASFYAFLPTILVLAFTSSFFLAL